MLSIPDCLRNVGENYEIVARQVLINGWYTYKPSWDWRFRFGNFLDHQGTFYRRDKLPLFDLKYLVFADVANNQQMYKAGYRCLILGDLIALHVAGGVSHNRVKRLERYRVFYDSIGIAGVLGTTVTYTVRGLKYHVGRLLRKRSAAPPANEGRQ